MNYDSLDANYWQTQIDLVEDLRRRIVQRGEATAAGRVTPDDDALVIGTGRRLNLAVLFLDISAFSSRPAGTRYEQDVLLRVLSLFFSEMVRIAEDYGGVIEKNTGDGLMAYFEDGGGESPTSGATKSVACALTMFAVNDYLIRPILSASAVEPIRFRVGIDSGPVTVARLGLARRFNSNVAIGTAANVASKLLDLAKPGELLIGQDVLARLPVMWQHLWTTPLGQPSGWMYTTTGADYPVHRYTGRWARLT